MPIFDATVTRNGLAYGRRGVVLTSMGIGTALVCWICASAFGVAAVFAASAVLFTIVKLAGAAYLAYLGIRSLLDSRHPRPSTDLSGARLAPARRIYRTGFLSAMLNPKLGVFFVTLLPQFVRPPAGAGAPASVGGDLQLHRHALAGGLGIGGEEDAGNCCLNHTLNDDREAHGALIDAQMVAVPDRAVRPKRGPAFSHRIENGLGADHVERGLLLTGEACTGEILGRRGA